MTRPIGRRAGVIVGCAVIAASTFAVAVGTSVGPAAAAATNPCKVLTKSEIQQAFGGVVGRGRHGISTRVSAQCQYLVGANADRPVGTVIVHVRTRGAKAAYDALEKKAGYVPIDGVPKSLYAEKQHVVNVLEGGVLLGVEGGFVITEPLPIHFYDDRTQLTDLARIGSTRV
jgi:hypothetical protein